MVLLSYLLQQNAGGIPVEMLLLGGMLFVFYFFMIRPQQKKAKEQQDFTTALSKGDRVVTTGGIHGKVLRSDEGSSSVLLEIDGNTKIRIEKSMISMDFTKAVQEDKS